MTFVAKLGGVSTLRPKAARLRYPPLRMFMAASLRVFFLIFCFLKSVLSSTPDKYDSPMMFMTPTVLKPVHDVRAS